MIQALLPAILLLVYAVAFGLAALGGGLPVFDDHPGQLYRLHHAIALGWAPWRLNPGWWAGYAELQYYPPGAAWLGAAIHAASLGALGVAQAYEAVLWIAWLLPGLATFALLTRVLGSAWLALPGAFVALTLSAGSRSGVEEGLRWGLVAARLGWGLLPLVALSLTGWVEGTRRAPVLAAPLIAAVILTHPAHGPAALALLALGACIGAGARRRRLAQAAMVGLLAVGLAAIWLLPLLVHLRMALPLAWGDGSVLGLLRRLARPLIVLLALAQLAAWLSTRSRAARTDVNRWLLAFAPAMAAIVLMDALLAPLGMAWLPADRLFDSFLLALVLGASLAAPLLAARLPRLGPAGAATAMLGAALVLSGGSPEPSLSLWPWRGQWPTYAETVRGTRMDVLWQVLRDAPPGRVLFLRSGVKLDYRPEWWRPHSHLTALTPVETGRAIVNGTFTHPSPIAGLLYTGSADAKAITALVEERDGAFLFGQPLAALTAGDLSRWMDLLAISAVVTTDADGELSALLDSPADFLRPRAVGPFRVYLSRVPRTLPAPSGAQTWRLTPPAGARGWIAAGFAYSPLWQAAAGGRSLATRRDALGMLEVDAPGGDGPIMLHHAPGAAEKVGVAVTALSAVLLAAALARRAGRSSAPPAADGPPG